MMRQKRILLFVFLILFAFGMGFIISSPAHAQCPSDVISFWTLDESVAGSYSDSVGTNDGAGGAAPPTPTAAGGGRINRGQDFLLSSTNTISVADLNDDFDWAGNQSFSIELWMKGIPGTTGAGPNNEVMVGRYDGGSALAWWLGVEGIGGATPGNFYLYIQDSSADGDLVELTPSSAMDDAYDGFWHHVVAVHDAGTNTVYLYVDGNQVDVQTSAVFSGDFASNADLNIGWLNVNPFYYFNGTLDEIAVYNDALTPTEVTEHFTAQGGPRYCVDLDTDGISDGEENAGPNNGDGNLDGILDMNQNTVTSLLTFSGTDYVTMDTSAGTLANCQAVDNPSAVNAPSDTNFPWGFFEFTINGVGAGNPATVTLRTPAGTAPETYYKYGPPIPGAAVAWYEFADDGQTGATINSNVVTLKFVDGLRGDDTAADGSIVDQGGPATTVSVTPPASGGGGGGCFIATAAYGSYIEPHVMTLRSLRDKYLLTSKLGRLFVDGYYRYSPPVANFISKHETLKAAVRTLLLPLVGVSYVLVNFGPVTTMTLLSLILAFCIFLVFIYKRRMRTYRPAA